MMRLFVQDHLFKTTICLDYLFETISLRPFISDHLFESTCLRTFVWDLLFESICLRQFVENTFRDHMFMLCAQVWYPGVGDY